MTIVEAYKLLAEKLFTLYTERESFAIADRIIKYITGLSKSRRIIQKEVLLNKEEFALYEDYTLQLLQGKPLQYVLHECFFAGMQFYVDENVLIPRPETEELVDLIVSENGSLKNAAVLDIGTGSGCIAIALKKKLSPANISAIDISYEALAVAKKNASSLGTDICFEKLDILVESNWERLSKFDLIVSNPPYIKLSEAAFMHKNVLAFEPASALFVPDNDPLLFYRKIALFGKQYLNKNGKLYFEIHEDAGIETISLLKETGYTNIKLQQDLQEKDRMISAERQF